MPRWPLSLLLLVLWFLCFCRTPVGRGRAWLRLALMQKKLSEYMKALINKKELLRYEHLVKLCSFLAMFLLYKVESYINLKLLQIKNSWFMAISCSSTNIFSHTSSRIDVCYICSVCHCGIYTGQAKMLSPQKTRKAFDTLACTYTQ